MNEQLEKLHGIIKDVLRQHENVVKTTVGRFDTVTILVSRIDKHYQAQLTAANVEIEELKSSIVWALMQVDHKSYPEGVEQFTEPTPATGRILDEAHKKLNEYRNGK